MDNNDINQIKNKFVMQSVENIILRIQDKFSKTQNLNINRDTILEEFDSLAESFHISINKNERKKLQLLRMQMHDKSTQYLLKKASELNKQKLMNKVVDIRTKN